MIFLFAGRYCGLAEETFYSASICLLERSMSDFSHADIERGSWLSLDGWAFLAATVFLLLIVIGIVPAVPG
jgi:hypothetical protein